MVTWENDLHAVQHRDLFPFTIEIQKQIFILGRGYKVHWKGYPGGGVTTIYADTGCAIFWGTFSRAENKFWGTIFW